MGERQNSEFRLHVAWYMDQTDVYFNRRGGAIETSPHYPHMLRSGHVCIPAFGGTPSTPVGGWRTSSLHVSQNRLSTFPTISRWHFFVMEGGSAMKLPLVQLTLPFVSALFSCAQCLLCLCERSWSVPLSIVWLHAIPVRVFLFRPPPAPRPPRPNKPRL